MISLLALFFALVVQTTSLLATPTTLICAAYLFSVELIWSAYWLLAAGQAPLTKFELGCLSNGVSRWLLCERWSLRLLRGLMRLSTGAGLLFLNGIGERFLTGDLRCFLTGIIDRFLIGDLHRCLTGVGERLRCLSTSALSLWYLQLLCGEDLERLLTLLSGVRGGVLR